MKAVAYMGPDDVRTVKADMPVCEPGHTLVRVFSAGICGSDMAIAAGKHPRARAPLIMGHEFAGDVIEVNTATGPPSNIQPGDRVTVYPLLSCGQCHACRNDTPHVCRDLRLVGIDRDGGFAEYVSVPTALVVKLPPSMPCDTAALVEPLAVGIHAVSMGERDASANAVVLGAGPIGLMVALALRFRGTREIVITDPNTSRLDRARRMGFRVIEGDAGDIAAAVSAMTAGEGADTLYECAGAESSAAQMCELVRSRGKIVMVGVHKAPHAVDLRTLNFREISMVGARVYTPENYQLAIEAVTQIPTEAIISHRLPIDDAPAGFDLMKHPDGVCKVIFNI